MGSIQRIVIRSLAPVLISVTFPAVAERAFMTPTLSDNELAAQRGGFVLNNLEISIGLEQVISLNGETLAINRLNIPNLNQVVSGASVPYEVDAVLSLIHSGQDGQALISATSGTGGWMTLIQNDLNGSVIRNVRQLNIELNNLGSGYRLPDNLREPMLQMLGH
ncbi:hypothetical protein [Marinobacter sp.]|uniref:hypothetical protein n=1 Tax=Marinobacter sp. TaxID=50741 RepID=UPI003565F287